jgi:hypothetical protein
MEDLVSKYEKILGAKTEVLCKIGVKYNEYKNRAERKKIDFKLTLEQFDFLVKKECFYCKIKTPNKPMGIDRVDNSKGYISSNVTPCCWECNRAKSDMTQREFFEYRQRFSNKKNKITNPNKKSFRRHIYE